MSGTVGDVTVGDKGLSMCCSGRVGSPKCRYLRLYGARGDGFDFAKSL